MDSTAADGTRGRILLVEDDPSAARFAVYVLGDRGGFDVTQVTDPVVAISLVRGESWDLVLTDLDLPHMTGLDLLASVRTICPGLPVVITTARAMAAPEAGSALPDADAFLQKPITPQRLIVVATALISGGRVSGISQPPGGRDDLL